jgi:hypothetical protein
MLVKALIEGFGGKYSGSGEVKNSPTPESVNQNYRQLANFLPMAAPNDPNFPRERPSLEELEQRNKTAILNRASKRRQ